MNADPIRAYVMNATAADGRTCTATVDLLRRPMSLEQATSALLDAVIAAKGPGFVDTYRVTEIR